MDKRIVITGGSRGIGKTIASAFLKNGDEVMIVSRNLGDLEAVQREFSGLGKVKAVPADVSSEEDVRRIAEEVEKIWGVVDVLVNAAGIYGAIGPVTEAEPSEWKKATEVNLFGTFLVLRAIVPLIKKQGGGVIINFSGGGEGPYPNFSAYAASKGGILRFTETAAEELKPYNIAVNAIAPGPVNTRFLEELLEAGPSRAGEENYKKALKQKETGGVPPERTAELCLFLASDQAAGLTGKVISAVWDAYPKFPEHIQEISSSDIYTFRRIKPEDRGFHW